MYIIYMILLGFFAETLLLPVTDVDDFRRKPLILWEEKCCKSAEWRKTVVL